MTNEYHGLYSTRTKQYIHYNHGWWCTECTNQLFEIDKQTDHTSEWLEVMRQWSEIGLLCIWDAILIFGNAMITLTIGLAWIVFCFFEGVDSDTRIYEQQLKERDGLERPERDSLDCAYKEVLMERQQLLKAIDMCKSNMRFDLGDAQYNSDRRELQESQQRLDLVNARLAGLENKLRTHKGV